MSPAILDTSILTRYFKGDKVVIAQANQHIALYGRLYITIITYYEVMRGIKHKSTLSPQARQQAYQREQKFQDFCYENQVFDLDQSACRHAAEIYVRLRSESKYYQESADILIAGIALANNCAVVTENNKHFAAMKGLQVYSW